LEYIQGKPRSQIVFIESSLEEKIEPDNPVRIIDAFVNSCKLKELGFTHAKYAPEGRPPYNPADLLKLYIYGYLKRVRTSRLLERECRRNLEMMWLLNELTRIIIPSPIFAETIPRPSSRCFATWSKCARDLT
jgi:transposase